MREKSVVVIGLLAKNGQSIKTVQQYLINNCRMNELLWFQ